MTGPGVAARIGDIAPEDWAGTVDRTLSATYLVARHTVADLVVTAGAFVAIVPAAALRWVRDHGAPCRGRPRCDRTGQVDGAGPCGRGARYNVVCSVQVDGCDKVGVAEVPVDRIPARRAARPRDVAHLAAFMTSQRSSYVTGAVRRRRRGFGGSAEVNQSRQAASSVVVLQPMRKLLSVSSLRTGPSGWFSGTEGAVGFRLCTDVKGNAVRVWSRGADMRGHIAELDADTSREPRRR